MKETVEITTEYEYSFQLSTDWLRDTYKTLLVRMVDTPIYEKRQPDYEITGFSRGAPEWPNPNISRVFL